MSTRATPGAKRAAVLYWSRFGTTAVIARAIEQGLGEAGLDTTLLKTDYVEPESLKHYDLICLGGPTEKFGANAPIRDFLRSTGSVRLEGKLAFAFDTKYHSRFSGSAAKYIEGALDDQGLRIISTRESAIVTSQREGGKVVGALLQGGEIEKFKGLGLKIGAKAAEFMTVVA